MMMIISEVANGTVMAGNSDEAPDKPSYGWLFATITAFGLLLFLALSFTLYHRRLMVRRRKEEEYNKFFRSLRPDLDIVDKKITRARSILTNTHNVENFTVANEFEYCNEAFEKEKGSTESFEDDESAAKISYAEWVDKHSEFALNKEIQDHDTYLRSVQARKNVLVADGCIDEDHEYSGRIDIVNKVQDKTVYKGDFLEKYSKRESITETEVDSRKKETKTTSTDVNMKFSSYMQSDVSESVKPSGHKIVVHKPPISNAPIDVANNEAGTLKKKTILKPINTKRKKRSLLSHTYKQTSNSLDVENRDKSIFYSEPRRSSDPSLFLDKEEAADPQDSNLFVNQNKVLFNPYYTDVGMPLEKREKRRSCTAEDEQEVDMFTTYHFQRERSLPVLDDIYNKHESASTWM